MLSFRTERCLLRPLTLADAPQIVTLLNEPDFIRFIGDKQVRNIEDAKQYLLQGPIASYQQHGFGLLAVEQVAAKSATFIGIAGLLKRDVLAFPDLGYAFLHTYSGQGFATEVGKALLGHATQAGIHHVMAITSLDNDASKRVLTKLGFRFIDNQQFANYDTLSSVFSWSSEARDACHCS